MEPIDFLYLALGLVVVVGLVWFVSRRSKSAAPASGQARISKTSTNLGTSLRRAWRSGVDAETWVVLEEALLAADVGVEATNAVVGAVKRIGPSTANEAKQAVSDELRGQFRSVDRRLRLTGHPAVILVVGVNGSGKTTTIAKLAKQLIDDANSVILGAADTFRAAAGEQLATWGQRLGVRVMRGTEGADAASVAFDTLGAARAASIDVAIIDTAGRLHGKKNLMAELGKIHRVVGGEKGHVDEVLLVLDATGGQNGLAQVREFAETVPVTGVVLTKLDGTARGGIVVAVEKDLGIPVKFIGLGEGLDDLEPFDPDRFVSELLESA